MDNPLSAWEEAIREGVRRRADESRRRAERGPRSMDGPRASGGIGGGRVPIDRTLGFTFCS